MNEVKQRAIQVVVENVEKKLTKLNEGFMPDIEVLKAKADVIAEGLKDVYKIEHSNLGE